ncbi:RNA-directed DNA polymerase [Paenibacillus sp. SZ31]|uniref:RNA-directed DNA polymerase n=1 Tax=Paenibacillus sp. SZ31 TaxID=2725555 RepID=UPI00146D565E|nr:RNA-directed DNA polymerase [Paenibacillus sp. SZ31]NMI06945.1 RNA-directed DNA polymerase [Paenibacillus sp. SZ31]
MKAIDLIKKGYFPAELPPVFTTEELARSLADISTKIKQVKEKKSAPAVHSIRKNMSSRRLLSVPNPLHQIQLSEWIENNWSLIKNEIRQSDISLSKPAYDDFRASVPYNDGSSTAYTALTEITDVRHVVYFDILDYYPSISYEVLSRIFADSEKELEFLLRSMSGEKERGLPIGPDTSYILAEFLGSQIDKKMVERFKVRTKAIYRYMDDIYIYLSSSNKSLLLGEKLSELLREYDLTLNEEKSNFYAIEAEQFEPIWKLQLLEYMKEKDVNKQRLAIACFFQLAFQTYHVSKDNLVLKYAVGLAQRWAVSPFNRKLLQSFMFRIAAVAPSVLPEMSPFFRSERLERKAAGQCLNSIIKYESSHQHGNEVCWALWYCIKQNLKVTRSSAKVLSKLDDPFVALLALDMYDSGLITEGLDFELWKTRMNQDALFGPYWILAYETAIKGWLEYDLSDLKKDPFFNLLADANVSFYRMPEEHEDEDEDEDEDDDEQEDNDEGLWFTDLLDTISVYKKKKR